MSIIPFFAGNDRTLVIEVIDDDTGEPKDLTDVELTWQCSRGTADKFSATPLLTKTIGNGITVTDAFNGLIEIELDGADTRDLVGTFYHELLMVDADGDEQNLIAETFTIKRRLVKPTPTP